MVNITLDRKDLEALVKGSSPSYELMDHPLIKANGTFTGGFADKWNWHLSASTTEQDLLEIYSLCKTG